MCASHPQVQTQPTKMGESIPVLMFVGVCPDLWPGKPLVHSQGDSVACLENLVGGSTTRQPEGRGCVGVGVGVCVWGGGGARHSVVNPWRAPQAICDI